MRKLHISGGAKAFFTKGRIGGKPIFGKGSIGSDVLRGVKDTAGEVSKVADTAGDVLRKAQPYVAGAEMAGFAPLGSSELLGAGIKLSKATSAGAGNVKTIATQRSSAQSKINALKQLPTNYLTAKNAVGSGADAIQKMSSGGGGSSVVYV